MALTKRKDIINELIYRMGQIQVTKADGVSTGLLTVVRHRDEGEEPFDLQEVPALNVKDGKCPVTHQCSYDEHALDVRLELVTCQRASVDDIDDLVAAVIQCADDNDSWGIHADGTNLEAHDIDLSQTGDTITSAKIDIVINYTTDKGKA